MRLRLIISAQVVALNTAYLVLLAILILVYFILNQSVKGRYIKELEPLDASQYKYKKLLPLGLWLFDELRLPSGRSYYVFLYQRVVMVYGTRYAKYYLKVHWGEKFLFFFTGMMVASFLGAVSGLSLVYLPFIPAAGILLFFLADKNLDDKARKRKLQFMAEFPNFISKLALLMTAGMHLRQALERIYKDAIEKTPIYSELGTVLDDFASGVSEKQAWQEFSERCKVKEITSFASMISQNAKIGGNQLVHELKRMTNECWEMRKYAAKQIGETASSRLIFPLMLMFAAILTIVITPAIMQFSSAF
jgi:tight adherence protein C